MSPNLLALAAITLWSTLAFLSVPLARVPPLLVMAITLTTGGLLSAPRWRAWRVPPRTLALGLYGLFAYHFCLFVALRRAPAVEANLINYLWPLLLVLLAPAVLPGTRLAARHVVGGLVGCAGAMLVIAGRSAATGGTGHVDGYLFALAAAVIWATYSLLCKRVAPFPTAAVGLFCLLAGVLSLGCHVALDDRYVPTAGEWLRLAVLGLGPLGAAFYLWDAALKRGDPRTIGLLSNLTPLLSTAWLVLAGHGRLTWITGLAALLIVGGAMAGTFKPAS
ncbi:MAG: DMT family transporter [Deltaproteobacteria bacterium]